MAVKIRLKRVGARNHPVYRVVVTDGRSPRDGRFIEEIGTYIPTKKEGPKFDLQLERAEYWLGVGAQPSETVTSMIKKARKAAKVEEPAEAAA
jgi:small subunit ribosomal protein S16